MEDTERVLTFEPCDDNWRRGAKEKGKAKWGKGN